MITFSALITACSKCNLKKASRPLDQIPDMRLKEHPHRPTWPELQQKAKAFPPKNMHEDWADYMQ